MFYGQELKLGYTAHVAIVIVVIATWSTSTRAQKSTGQAGYYPDCYQGDVFSGTLTAADDNTGEMTLTYTNPKNGKVQTLVAKPDKGYTVRSRTNPTAHPLRASELSLGKSYTVYYCSSSEKANGTKTTVYSIFRIEGVPNLETYRLIYKLF